MPWVVDPEDIRKSSSVWNDAPEWYPYGYETKPKFVWQSYFGDYHYYGQPRLPPNYFTKGYKFYRKAMKNWYSKLEDERREYNEENHTNYPLEYFNDDGKRLPLFYTYPQFIAKARKYALRKRHQMAGQRHRQAMLQRIQRNREIAQYRRRLIVNAGRNKY